MRSICCPYVTVIGSPTGPLALKIGACVIRQDAEGPLRQFQAGCVGEGCRYETVGLAGDRTWKESIPAGACLFCASSTLTVTGVNFKL